MLKLIQDPRIRAYALERQSLRPKPVSHEQAMRQILLYSPEPRQNIYASGLINKDGALILLKP